MFTHMELVHKEWHQACENAYELEIYKMIETGEYRIFISKNGEGLEMLASANGQTVSDGKATGTDVVEILIQAARDEIDTNEWGRY